MLIERIFAFFAIWFCIVGGFIVAYMAGRTKERQICVEKRLELLNEIRDIIKETDEGD